MKIIVTGSLGNISKPLAQILVAAGHQVTIISSDKSKVEAIEALGAKAAIGSITDAEFLTGVFTGADAVYTMVPPKFDVANYREYYNIAAKVYATAITNAGIKHIVNLSSMGAHLPDGTGPIKGLYDLENIFNALDGVAIKHLRPVSFYTNFYSKIGLIQHAGILGDNFGAETRLLLVHPNDIAEVAAEELVSGFTGNSVRYIASDERTAAEVTSILGKAIGKPNLQWVEFSDADSLAGMLQAGLPEEIAKNFTEMGAATRTGILREDYDKHKPAVLGKIKLEDFAAEFARAL